MNEIKYVILIPKGMNEQGARAMIFNGSMNHKEAVFYLTATGQFKVRSAGFCTVFPEIKAWGESVSLSVKSLDGDAEIIERTLKHNHSLTDMFAHS